jgi:hypothetical protein
VADAAGVLLPHMAHGERYDWEVRGVLLARARFLALGQRAAESLPSPDDPPIAPYPLITFVQRGCGEQEAQERSVSR